MTIANPTVMQVMSEWDERVEAARQENIKRAPISPAGISRQRKSFNGSSAEFCEADQKCRQKKQHVKAVQNEAAPLLSALQKGIDSVATAEQQAVAAAEHESVRLALHIAARILRHESAG